MVPVPASHAVVSVELQSKAPLTVHVSEPKSIAEPAADIFNAPVMVALPEVLVRSPPLMVNAPAASVWVFFATVPPEIVIVLVTTRLLPRVAIPVVTVSALNVLSEPRRVMVAVASNV